jgi:hypothetical protein
MDKSILMSSTVNKELITDCMNAQQRISLMRAISLFGRSLSSDLLVVNFCEVPLNPRTEAYAQTVMVY